MHNPSALFSCTSMITFVAAIRSIVTYVVVTCYVLLMGPVTLLLALVMGSPRMLYAVGLLGVRLGLFLSGIRTERHGLEHVQRHRAAVYAVNHASNMEPPVIFNVLHELFPRLRILYKAELRKLPILVRAIDLAADALRDGNSFLIFPEGTRSRTGELLPFKKGGFIMALKAQAPIVPVAIKGARNAMRKGSPIIYPVRVQVRLGAPIETAGLGVEHRDELVARVRGEVARMLKL